MSNRFGALAEEQPKPVGRDSKTHEPKAPVHGRQYDRNSVKEEKRFPSKEGRGKGGWGNAKDESKQRPPREETAEQKERRELREKEHADALVKHQEYLSTLKTLDDQDIQVIAEQKIDKQVTVTCPQDILTLGKATKKADKKNQKNKQYVVINVE